MRFTIINFFAAALVVFGTTVAGASSFTVSKIGTTCVGPCVVGDTVDLELTIDASDLVDAGSTFGYGISILIGGDAVWGTILSGVIGTGSGGSFVGVGLQNTGQFEVDAGAFGIVGGAAQAGTEPQNTVFANVITMATFISGIDPVTGINVDYTNAYNSNFVARVTMQLLAPGFDPTIFLAAGAGPGDGFDLNGTDILASFSSNLLGLDVVPIPEPGTALLMALGLIGLSAAGRRREA